MQHGFSVTSGQPAPLGVSRSGNDVNFSFYTTAEENVSLMLFCPREKKPFAHFPLDPEQNRTGNIWHLAVKNLTCLFDYGIQIGKELLIDPYARALNTDNKWNNGTYTEVQPLGHYSSEPSFDWENDAPPLIPQQNLIIYEMHIRGFTEDSASHVQHPGTFLGMIEKIPYLKELGINAVELLPIFEFDENDNPKKNPKTGKKLMNYWGYSTVNFFSLMNRYGT
ncbi:MAG: alpha-amylase family glycosyl hydrolase, partial [Thermodesulfobacteriota bacterium]